MKKIIYRFIKYPLILIFIKTPLINILKKRFKLQTNTLHSEYNKNLFYKLLDILFQKEYFNKLQDKFEIRKLTNSTLTDGEGREQALHYYNIHFQTLEELKKRQIGRISASEASPIYEKMINFFKSNNLVDDKSTFIIQLGSSSGRDLEFFNNLFPKLKYISTDINDEILNFQKEKYNYSNLQYFKCYAEDIDKCINNLNIFDKNIILFSCGSLQYVNPFFLKDFFFKLGNYKKLNLFINEPISLSFIEKNKSISDNRGNTSFSHRYDEYAKNSKIKIIESHIIRPYPKNDKNKYDVGRFYLHLTNHV